MYLGQSSAAKTIFFQQKREPQKKKKKKKKPKHPMHIYSFNVYINGKRHKSLTMQNKEKER